MDIIWKHYA